MKVCISIDSKLKLCKVVEDVEDYSFFESGIHSLIVTINIIGRAVVYLLVFSTVVSCEGVTTSVYTGVIFPCFSIEVEVVCFG